MKKELKSGILSADKSAYGRPTVFLVNVIAVIDWVHGGSNKYPQSVLGAKIRKHITIFNLKVVLFTVVKIPIYCIGVLL